MSKYIKNVPCPKCRENGEDRTGDNLSMYSDGSAYCYKCHYYILSDNALSNYKAKHSNETLMLQIPKILLPKDCEPEYPDKCVNWINSYELDKSDMLHNGVLWSDQQGRLVFPLWNNGELLGWQGRYFGSDKSAPKWFSKGDMLKIVHVLFKGKVGQHNLDANQLILCEDIVSAIKVSKLGFHAMPLFGVNIKGRIPQFRVLRYLQYIIFLDEDMHQHSLKESLIMRLNGFKVHSILSSCDPKEYSYNKLKEILNEKYSNRC
jgi:hypothetical protein